MRVITNPKSFPCHLEDGKTHKGRTLQVSKKMALASMPLRSLLSSVSLQEVAASTKSSLSQKVIHIRWSTHLREAQRVAIKVSTHWFQHSKTGASSSPLLRRRSTAIAWRKSQFLKREVSRIKANRISPLPHHLNLLSSEEWETAKTKGSFLMQFFKITPLLEKSLTSQQKY